MATDRQLAVAKEYFESNPSEGVLHISTDGQVFFQKNYNDGAGHQRRIDPTQKMTTIFRKDVEQPESKKADALPLDKMTKAQLMELLSAKGIATTGKEKRDELQQMASEAMSQEDNKDEDDND